MFQKNERSTYEATTALAYINNDLRKEDGEYKRMHIATNGKYAVPANPASRDIFRNILSVTMLKNLHEEAIKAAESGNEAWKHFEKDRLQRVREMEKKRMFVQHAMAEERNRYGSLVQYKKALTIQSRDENQSKEDALKSGKANVKKMDTQQDVRQVNVQYSKLKEELLRKKKFLSNKELKNLLLLEAKVKSGRSQNNEEYRIAVSTTDKANASERKVVNDRIDSEMKRQQYLRSRNKV